MLGTCYPTAVDNIFDNGGSTSLGSHFNMILYGREANSKGSVYLEALKAYGYPLHEKQAVAIGRRPQAADTNGHDMSERQLQ